MLGWCWDIFICRHIRAISGSLVIHEFKRKIKRSLCKSSDAVVRHSIWKHRFCPHVNSWRILSRTSTNSSVETYRHRHSSRMGSANCSHGGCFHLVMCLMLPCLSSGGCTHLNPTWKFTMSPLSPSLFFLSPYLFLPSDKLKLGHVCQTMWVFRRM